MRDRIEKGEYQMGELIVPRLYRIVKIDKDTNTTVEEEIEISGRKVPLLCIRQNLQKKFLDAGIVRYPTLNIPNLRKDEISRVLTNFVKSILRCKSYISSHIV